MAGGALARFTFVLVGALVRSTALVRRRTRLLCFGSPPENFSRVKMISPGRGACLSLGIFKARLNAENGERKGSSLRALDFIINHHNSLFLRDKIKVRVR